MKLNTILFNSAVLALVSIPVATLSAIAASPGTEAIDATETEAPKSAVLRLKDRAKPATTLKEWRHQILTQNTPVQVTGVKVDRTDTGIDITLETADDKPLQVDASKFRTDGNTLIADIPNAVLVLPNNQPFAATNPTADISTIRVTQQAATNIRVSVVGNQALPKTEVTLKVGGLAYALSPDDETADDELVVTGLGQRGYRVPNASTATGTDTPIIETPFSVQVVPQDVLRDQQVIRLEDALTNISGVISAGNNGGREAAFSIRGFGNQFSSSVPTLRDGYRLYGSFQGISEIGILDRVEVLKGPASILYGEIEPGGIINLVSKKPLAIPFYEAELQVGSRELVRPRIDLTGPLTADGSLLYRLNALYQHDRSFRNFDIDTDRVAVAPTLTWKIGDRTDLTVSLDYIHQESPADFGITKFGDGVAPVSRAFVANNPDDSITTDYLSAGYSFEHRFNDDWKIRNGFRYISYDYDYSVIALPFLVIDSDIIRFFADQDGQDRSYALTTSVVGKFATGSVKHTLTAGVDLNRSEYLPQLPRLLTGKGIHWDRTKTDFYRDKYVPIEPDQGNLLYLIARSIQAKTIVEFGTSFGISTLYLAAAVRDNGGGKVIGTELILFTATGYSLIWRMLYLLGFPGLALYLILGKTAVWC